MQQIIDKITDRLVSLVKSDRPVYTPKELLKAGIPSFVVERIRMVLEDKVREEIQLPSAHWYDQTSRLVMDAWSDFEQNAVSNSYIPAEELYNIVNHVTGDVLRVFIEPRKNMAEYIFRGEDELNLEELTFRGNQLTIYKHFGAAIPLYMKKRELETLTKERCEQLIRKLDAKLVASYTPAEWAKKLEQLFVLFGGKVEPGLLQRFFDDKGLNQLSKRFEGYKSEVSQEDFIYIISSDDADELITESEEPEITKEDIEKAEASVKDLSEKTDTEQSLIESFFGDYDYVPYDETEEGDVNASLAESYVEGNLTEEEMDELLTDIASEGVIEVDEYTDFSSLNSMFSVDGAEDEEAEISETTSDIADSIKDKKHRSSTEDLQEFRDNLTSILEDAKSSFEDIEQEEGDELIEDSSVDEPEDPPVLIAEELDEEEDPIPDNEDEQPMWAKFLSADQMNVIMGGERSKEREITNGEESEKEIDLTEFQDDEPIDDLISVDEEISVNDDGFIDDSIPGTPNKDILLTDILIDRKAEFIELLFAGSEDAYNSAIDTIQEFESWKETSAYIHKEVFTKNDVDLFTGAAVDFTDRMHRYFNGLL